MNCMCIYTSIYMHIYISDIQLLLHEKSLYLHVYVVGLRKYNFSRQKSYALNTNW